MLHLDYTRIKMLPLIWIQQSFSFDQCFQFHVLFTKFMCSIITLNIFLFPRSPLYLQPRSSLSAFCHIWKEYLLRTRLHQTGRRVFRQVEQTRCGPVVYSICYKKSQNKTKCQHLMIKLKDISKQTLSQILSTKKLV